MDADIVAAVLNAKRVIVLTGAGISTRPPASLPDYRTCRAQGLTFARADVGSPAWLAFVDRCRAAEPTTTHQFCAWLHARGTLVRVYTQNVDGLHERTPGLPRGKVVAWHGSVDGETDVVMDGELTALHQPFGKAALETDFLDPSAEPDLCLVLGTALEREPFKYLPNRFAKTACRIYVNRDCATLERARDAQGPEIFGLGYSMPSSVPRSLKIAKRQVTTRATWLDQREDASTRDDWRNQYIVEMDCDSFCQRVMNDSVQ